MARHFTLPFPVRKVIKYVSDPKLTQSFLNSYVHVLTSIVSFLISLIDYDNKYISKNTLYILVQPFNLKTEGGALK